MTHDIGEETTETTRVYVMRHVQLAVFCLLTTISGMAWVTFAPIATSVMEHYSISSTAINWLSMCYMVLYAPGSVLSSVVMDSLGLRACLVTGALLTALGASLRLVGVLHFAVLMVGQCFMAFAQCFFLAAPPVIALRWYPQKERSAATSIAITCNYVGVALSFGIPLFISMLNFRIGFLIVLGVQCVVCVLGFLLALVLIRSRPALPPSPLAHSSLGEIGEQDELVAKASQEAEEEDLEIDKSSMGSLDDDIIGKTNNNNNNNKKKKKKSRWTNILRQLHLQMRMIWSAFTNFQFVLLATSLGIVQGVSYAYSSLLEQITVPLGFTQEENGVFGLVIIISGIVCSILLGYIMDRTRHYELLLKLGFVGFALSTALMTVSIAFSTVLRTVGLHMVAMLLSCALFGSISTGIIPVCIILGVEITYPNVGESQSTHIQILSAQLFGIVLISTMDFVTSFPSIAWTSNWICLTIGCLITMAIVMMFRARLHRMETEGKMLLSDTYSAPLLPSKTTVKDHDTLDYAQEPGLVHYGTDTVFE